jgi:hypothetical protein
MVVQSVEKVLAQYREGEETHISSIEPAPQRKPVFRERESPTIDGAAMQHDRNTVSESRIKPDVSARTADTNQVTPWGAAPADPVAIIVFAPGAFANFQTASGARYLADEQGAIRVTDPGDAEDLLRAGCRRA